MTDKSIIVVSQIKPLAKVGDKQLSVAMEFYEELNSEVKRMVEKACKRAIANNRNTVMGRDV